MIFKRALNVIVVVATLWLVLLLALMATGGVSDWPQFIGKNIFPVVVVYVSVPVVNYVLFGRIALWHKSTK